MNIKYKDLINYLLNSFKKNGNMINSEFFLLEKEDCFLLIFHKNNRFSMNDYFKSLNIHTTIKKTGIVDKTCRWYISKKDLSLKNIKIRG